VSAPSESPLSGIAARPLLAFGAHPDDIEFGCGAVIAREALEGRFAHFVIATRGEAATHGTPAARSAEAGRAAEALGATVEFIELGGDAHLSPAVPQTIALAAIIRRMRPRCILAPTTTPSQHPDHIAIGTMTRDAARLARYGGLAELRGQPPHSVDLLLTYAITVEAEPAGVMPILVDVSAPSVMQHWQAALAAHESQSRTRNYAELQLTRARQYGLRAGVEYAWPLWPGDPLVFDSLQPLTRSARRF
jgi:N-acetylglucosamine malate deacetylase 1